jgi:hypothetical protein
MSGGINRWLEMNAAMALCEIGFDLGEYDLIEAHVERGLDLARMLGAHAWEAPVHLPPLDEASAATQ